MSKKDSSSSAKPSKNDKAPDLSALDFGPAWARNDASSKPKQRSGKGSNHGSTNHGGDRKPPPRGSDRRRNDGNHGGNRRRDSKSFDRRERREHKPPTPPAEGISARIMPIEEGMDALAKEISAQGRTHSVFDLAWLVLGGLDRFHVIFESEEQALYQSKADHSAWLTKQECLSHFWSSGMVKNYYDEEITEGEAPTGNFQSIARCGLSGKIIGPPNHHSYQQTLTDIHHARYANMPIERYKSKIVIEHGEEAVEKWVEQVKKQSIWRPKPAQPADLPETPKAEEKEKIAEEVITAESAPQANEEAAANEPNETPVETPAPAIEDTLPVFKTRREVEQHFLIHGFDNAFKSDKAVSVLASIPAKMISPGLMATLKHTVAEEKKYPGKLASFLCRQMSGRHLAVYKWKKRLHCGPARPKHVPDDMVMADRPSKLFHWVLENPAGTIDKMWKDCLPKDIDDETRHTWYHDLHWLINEGLVLLFSDGKLHAAKELNPDPPKTKKAAKKSAKKKIAKQAEKDAQPSNDTAQTSNAPPEPKDIEK